MLCNHCVTTVFTCIDDVFIYSSPSGVPLESIVALPGYWRPDPVSEIFSSCTEGFTGTEEVKVALAEKNCCPLVGDTNVSKCTNLTFTDPEEQCLDGYTGALCLVCAEGYVKQGDACTVCESGASLTNAFMALLIFCVPIFLVVFLVLHCSVKDEKVEKGATVFGKIKIIIAYIQILSALPG